MVLILVFAFLAYSQSQKAHVSVDLLVRRFPEKLQVVIELFNHSICLILMALITWMGFKKALELKEVGEASPNLQIPDYPFVFFLAFGCAVVCLEFIRDLLRLFSTREESIKP
jgi:TRAP-type C4-dicarboxylate transport system permease small subunit